MSPNPDPILHEGARVSLDVGGDAEFIDCRVVGLTGDELALLPVRPPQPAAWRRLAMRGPCHVVFEANGQMRALRGTAGGVRPGGYLAVVLTDDFRLGQKRRHSRAPLSLPVALSEPEAGEAWSSESLDVSAAGVRVARPDVAEPARAGTLTLTLPDREVVAPGAFVQGAAGWMSYRFLSIEPDARQAIAALVLAYHRSRPVQRRPE